MFDEEQDCTVSSVILPGGAFQRWESGKRAKDGTKILKENTRETFQKQKLEE